jgi:hypothetical protein
LAQQIWHLAHQFTADLALHWPLLPPIWHLTQPIYTQFGTKNGHNYGSWHSQFGTKNAVKTNAKSQPTLANAKRPQTRQYLAERSATAFMAAQS